MNVNQVAKDIKKLHVALTGKSDPDLTITYRGTANGVITPWMARIDARETAAETYESAVQMLFNILKVDLQKKADGLARDAEALTLTLNALKN